MVPAERGARARVPETVAGAAWRAGPSQDMGVAMLRVCLPPKSRCVGGWLSVTKISPSGHDEESRVCSQARVPNSSVSLVSGPGSALRSLLCFSSSTGFLPCSSAPPEGSSLPLQLSLVPSFHPNRSSDRCLLSFACPGFLGPPALCCLSPEQTSERRPAPVHPWVCQSRPPPLSASCGKILQSPFAVVPLLASVK